MVAVICEVWGVECGVWSVECGVRGEGCGVWGLLLSWLVLFSYWDPLGGRT